MITVAEMVRVTRKGGQVTHLALSAGVSSLCGRVALMGERVPADRLCKSCARVARVEDTEGTWTEAQKTFISMRRTGEQWAMLEDVVRDYEKGEENSASRIALYRAALATRNYATTVITNNPDSQRRNTDGNSMGYGKGKLVNEIAEKQVDFLRVIYTTIDEAFGMGMLDAFNEQLEKGKYTKSSASKLIDSVLPLFNGAKKEIDRKRQEEIKVANPSLEELKEGMYGNGEKIWKVKISQSSGKPYAMLLTELAEPVVMKTATKTHEFVYAPGEVRNITPDMLLSLADAKAFGRRTGTCCCCGRTLTKAISIEQGIGPVCADKF